MNSVEYVFAEDGIILDAVGRQLRSASKTEIGIQVGIFFLLRSTEYFSFYERILRSFSLCCFSTINVKVSKSLSCRECMCSIMLQVGMNFTRKQ